MVHAKAWGVIPNVHPSPQRRPARRGKSFGRFKHAPSVEAPASTGTPSSSLLCGLRVGLTRNRLPVRADQRHFCDEVGRTH